MEAQIKIDKKTQAKLNGLNAKIQAILQEKLTVIRTLARRQGIVAEKLEDLKSKSGLPFAIETGRSGYIGAAVKKNVSLGAHVFVDIAEVAYFCPGCGWVKGSPKSTKYNDIGPLSGSAGINYHCKICEAFVGKEVHVRS